MLAVTASSLLPTGNGRAQRFEQAFGDQLRAGAERGLLGHHDELVAAQPSERVGVPDEPVQPRRDAAQELVAGAVAERVVDRP